MNIGRFDGSSQAGLLDRRLFFFRAMLARLSQVQHGFHAVGFQLRKVLEPGLAARAELGRDLNKVADGWQLLRDDLLS
jgi:hypothetical protein